MKSIFFAASALMLLSGAAAASDLPSKNAPVFAPAPAAITPAFSWTGFYVGGYLGGAFGNSSVHPLLTPTIPDISVRISNPTVGVFSGFNYQFNNLVAGGEGELGYDGSKGRTFYANIGSTVINRRTDSSESYVGRLRGRIGFTATPQLLLFAAGGVTFADQKVVLHDLAVPANDLGLKRNRIGWNLGVGAEYAFASNMTARIEYIYDGFSKKAYDFSVPSGGFWKDREIGLNKSTVRVGVAMKF